jgi:hypothetical protein
VLTYRYSGKRRNADLFAWLTRAATGTSHPCRGVVDSRTGAVRFYGKGLPRPTPRGCPLGKRRRCLADRCGDDC